MRSETELLDYNEAMRGSKCETVADGIHSETYAHERREPVQCRKNEQADLHLRLDILELGQRKWLVC